MNLQSFKLNQNTQIFLTNSNLKNFNEILFFCVCNLHAKETFNQFIKNRKKIGTNFD